MTPRMDLRTALIASNALELVKALSKDMNGDLPQSRDFERDIAEGHFEPAANLLGVGK
jgi:hypothetical protein